jgi:malonyl-CoA decarboxylase
MHTFNARVHQIRSLSDLKNRLSSSRRCFIYTHSSMPNEPLVILHIALTNQISSNIADLIGPKDANKKEMETNEYTNAIFYSINLCQKGLQQVDLGNSLIKSCVRLLIEEFPYLKLFHTLSPIPKFKEWLDSKLFISSMNTSFFEKLLNKKEIQVLSEYFQVEFKDTSALIEKINSYLNSHQYKADLKERLDQPLDTKKITFNHLIEKMMVHSCSYYLYYEKKNGYAFNSVTNFHIKNGAEIYRINYGGDISDKGIKSSYGLMVNYGYYVHDLEDNCVNYLIDKKIQISDIFEKQLGNFLLNSKI